MGPVRTWIKSWFESTPKEPDTVPVQPEPVPELPPDPIEPSRVQLVNYIRALLILKNTPFKELREEFFKLPLKQLAYFTGTLIWFFMSYTFLKYLLGL
jgi:hypothetical protein